MQEGSSGDAPLGGIRVVELSQALAAPFAGCMLGDPGAEVIKVEPPERGEPARQFGPHFIQGESWYFLGFNRNKKGITLNLQHRSASSTYAARARYRSVA